MSKIVLPSALDASVNFIQECDTGFEEARYVRRSSDYMIAYLSSQTGCNRGCKFCHLTASGQTSFRDCSVEDFVRQTREVLSHYSAQSAPCNTGHCNLMARGEPLANRHLVRDGDAILHAIGSEFLVHGLRPKFNISTIMPVTLRTSLADVFRLITPTIYWSCYSADDDWRRRWLPAAMAFDDAVCQLAEYQRASKKIVKLHCAFIAGENDDPDDVRHMVDRVARSIEHLEFGIVRYNPPDETSRETDHLSAIYDTISAIMPTKIISRVGEDCMASCGMFYAN